MKKNPISVTRFGASHSGNSSTKAFHCSTCSVSELQSSLLQLGSAQRSYIVPHDVFANRALIHARVLVRLQMRQGFVRKAFCHRDTYSHAVVLAASSPLLISHVILHVHRVAAQTRQQEQEQNRTEQKKPQVGQQEYESICAHTRLLVSLPMIEMSLSPLVGVVTGSGSASLKKALQDTPPAGNHSKLVSLCVVTLNQTHASISACSERTKWS